MSCRVFHSPLHLTPRLVSVSSGVREWSQAFSSFHVFPNMRGCLMIHGVFLLIGSQKEHRSNSGGSVCLRQTYVAIGTWGVTVVGFLDLLEVGFDTEGTPIILRGSSTQDTSISCSLVAPFLSESPMPTASGRDGPREQRCIPGVSMTLKKWLVITQNHGWSLTHF